jgi:hypothetical protein
VTSRQGCCDPLRLLPLLFWLISQDEDAAAAAAAVSAPAPAPAAEGTAAAEAAEAGAAAKALSPEDLELEKIKLKRHMLGRVRFLGELFKLSLVRDLSYDAFMELNFFSRKHTHTLSLSLFLSFSFSLSALLHSTVLLSSFWRSRRDTGVGQYHVQRLSAAPDQAQRR